MRLGYLPRGGLFVCTTECKGGREGERVPRDDGMIYGVRALLDGVTSGHGSRHHIG